LQLETFCMSRELREKPASFTPPESAGGTSKTIAYYAAFVALGLIGVSLGPTLPGLAQHTKTRLSEISFLFTARSLGYLLGSFQGGRLYDRVAGHPLMAAVLTIMALVMVLVPLMSVLWLLAALLLILGMAEGALDVGGNTLLVWVHRHRVGPFMNGLHFFFGVGAFISPVIIAHMVAASGDINWAYWVLATTALPVIVWLSFIPSPAVKISSQDGPVERVNNGLVALIALFFLLLVGAEASFGGWIFTYALALGLGDKTSAAYLTSAFWGALTLGRLAAIPISARFEPIPILMGDLAGCLVSVVVILLWPDSIVATWLGTLGFGFSMASAFPTLLSLAQSRMTITGRVTGWFFVGSSAGGMSLPWLIGQVFESVGPKSTMFVIMADLVVAMAIFALLVFYSARPALSGR
jgi:fucose permease